jgi:hypothetical protein
MMNRKAKTLAFANRSAPAKKAAARGAIFRFPSCILGQYQI